MTPKALKQIIQDYIKEDATNLEEHNIIKEFLFKNDGKVLTAKMKFPEPFKFNIKYGMYHLDGNVSHLISYSAVIDAKQFDKYDICSGEASVERIEKLNGILNDPERFNRLLKLSSRIEKAYNDLINAMSELKKGEFNYIKNPAYYSILRTILGENHMSALS